LILILVVPQAPSQPDTIQTLDEEDGEEKSEVEGSEDESASGLGAAFDMSSWSGTRTRAEMTTIRKIFSKG